MVTRLGGQMTNWFLAVALVLMTFPSNGIAQSKDALVGTWKLVSAKDTPERVKLEMHLARTPQDFSRTQLTAG